MTKPPTAENYSPDRAKELDDGMERVSTADVRGAEAVFKVKALQSLVQALDSALKIGHEHYVEGRREPYTGAAGKVLRQARAAVELARKTGLMP